MPKKNLSEHILSYFAQNLLAASVRSLPLSAQMFLDVLRKIASKNKKLPEHYDEYIRSKEWKDRRSIILIQQKGCAVCERGDNASLHIHHLIYDNFGDEEPSDCIGLCLRCHAYVHNKGLLIAKWMQLHYSDIVSAIALSLMSYGLDYIPHEIAQPYSWVLLDKYPTPKNEAKDATDEDDSE